MKVGIQLGLMKKGVLFSGFFTALCALFFFMVPFNGKFYSFFGLQQQSNFLSVVLVLLLVFSPFVKGWDPRGLSKNKVFRLFLLFFAFYLVSELFITPSDKGLGELVKKLSFVVIPILILANPTFFDAQNKKLFLSYFLGVLFTVLYLDVKAILFFIETSTIPVYANYTLFTHPTYLGANVLLAFVFFLSFYIKSKRSIKHAVLQLLVAYVLLAHLFVILSKAALICAIIVFVSFAIFLLFRHRKKLVYYLLIGLLPCVLVFASFRSVRLAFVKVQSRFKELENYENKDGSTSFRFQIVKGLPELMSDKLLTGAGVGNEESVLLAYYKKQDWSRAISKKYNSHNQFIQISLSVGVIGAVLFIALMLIPLFQDRQKGDKVILICFIVLFCTEAMLERQAGIVLFMLFYSFAFGVPLPKKKS